MTFSRPKRNPPQSPAFRDGDCPECGGYVYEGDMMSLIDDVWMCEECRAEALS